MGATPEGAIAVPSAFRDATLYRVDPQPEQKRYPVYVVTDEQKRRWDAAEKAAEIVAEDMGGNQETVVLATRSLYNSDIPTGPPEPDPSGE